MDLYPLWQSHTFGPVQLPCEEQLLTRSQETTTVTTTKGLRILWWINIFGLTAIHASKQYLDFHTNGWERSASLGIPQACWPSLRKKYFSLIRPLNWDFFPSAILAIGAIVEIMWNHANQSCNQLWILRFHFNWYEGFRPGVLLGKKNKRYTIIYRCNTLNKRHCNWNFLRSRTKR